MKAEINLLLTDILYFIQIVIKALSSEPHKCWKALNAGRGRRSLSHQGSKEISTDCIALGKNEAVAKARRKHRRCVTIKVM